MAGPTPVSALIHAATMVTAGVYMIGRNAVLFEHAPTTLLVVAAIGAATALMAGTIGLVQNDIKRVLAYSTVSQLGYMFLAMGVGAFGAGVFHLYTHAFFKACLFLGAGSVMHGNGDEEDVTKLGGLRKEMPVTWATFLVSTFAITGVIPLSGFFSKDAILHAAHTQHIAGYHGLQTLAWIMGTLTAACTAFYMFRAYFLTFEGERSKEAKIPHAHESAAAMTGPLVVLAVLAVVALLHGLPIMHSQRGGVTVTQTLMENFLDPVFRTTNALIARTQFLEMPREHESMLLPWLQAWIIALVSGAAAFFIYRRYLPAKGSLPGFLEPLRKFSFNKFFVDEVYDFVVIKPLTLFSRALHKVVDSIFIDGMAVHGTAWLTARTGAVLRYLQTGDAQMYAAVMALAASGGLVWAIFKVLP